MKEKIINRSKNEKKTIKGKRKATENIIIMVSVGLLALSFVYSFSSISISWLNISLPLEKQHDLFINLFTVQATIATLSISIIAIITGFQTESIYGVTVTNYITTLKPCLLKHKFLMIADLVITGLNYVLVSFSLFNISLMIFVISIIISCILIIDTSFVFKSHSEISSEIGEFIKENTTVDIINELEKSLNDHATNDNVAGVEEDLVFLNAIFEFELNKNNCSETILQSIEKSLTNLFINSYLSTNKNLVFSILKTINSSYEVINQSNNKYPIDIWSNIYIEFLTFIGSASAAQLNNDNKFNFIFFKWNIEKSIVFEDINGQLQEKNNFYTEYYYSWVYKYIVLKNNDNFESEDIQHLKKRIYQAAYREAFYYSGDKPLELKNITGLCYLNKLLIENGDLVLLNNEYLRHEQYWVKENKHAYVYLANIIYSIYLAYQEPIVRGASEQKNAEGYLDIVRKQDIFTQIYYMDIVGVLDESYMRLFKLLSQWEKFEDGVMKTVTMEPTVQDMLFFICIEKYYDEKTLAKCFRIITSNNVESILVKYFNNENKFVEKYQEFYRKLYGKDLSKNHLASTQSLVRGALEREYKYELVETVKEKYIDSELIRRFEKKLNDFLNFNITDYHIFDNRLDNIETTQIKIDPGHLVDLNEFNNNNLGAWLTEYVSNCFYNELTSHLKNNVNLRKISQKSTNKQETLIGLSKGINPDTFIGCRETFWNEKNKNLLSDFIERMNKISASCKPNNLYLLNSTLIHFSITNIHCSFNNCTNDGFDYINYFNIDVKDGEYYYSRYSSSDVKAKFTKNELFELLNKTYKHLIITADINYAVKEDLVGCGIEITY